MALYVPPALNENRGEVRIGDLPPSARFATLDELHEFLQQWGLQNGVCFAKRGASNPRFINGQRVYTYVRLSCDRGGKARPSKSSGKRISSSRLCDCKFQVQASCKAQLNNMWEYAVVQGHDKHNHEPSRHAVAHKIFRRRTPEHKKAIRELISALPGITACEIAERLKLQYPEVVVTGRDIENERQMARLDALSQSHHEPPVKAPAKDKRHKPKFGTPEWIYAKYKFARTKWYKEKELPVHLRTNEAYREERSLTTYSKRNYAWCVGWKYMGKKCTSVSPNRPWTKEEKMAWMDDWHRRQLAEYSIADKEHTDNNFTFPGCGAKDIWLTAEARLAAEKLAYEDDEEYEL